MWFKHSVSNAQQLIPIYNTTVYKNKSYVALNVVKLFVPYINLRPTSSSFIFSRSQSEKTTLLSELHVPPSDQMRENMNHGSISSFRRSTFSSATTLACKTAENSELLIVQNWIINSE